MTIAEVLVNRLNALSKFVDKDLALDRMNEVGSVAKALYDAGHIDADGKEAIDATIDRIVFHIR
jgi:sugar phosphate isomerase/epimerase